MHLTKEEVLRECTGYVQNRLSTVQQAIDDANYSLMQDTKSSAGDKYETGREMIQQELNRLQQQMNNALADQEILRRIETMGGSAVAGMGSLVVTDTAIYFVSISIGARTVEDQTVFVVSAQSPVGQLLVGLSVKDKFTFNNKTQQIVSIS